MKRERGYTKVSFVFFGGNSVTPALSSTHLLLVFLVSLPHRRDTTVSLQTKLLKEFDHCVNLLSLTPLRKTLRARDHVTHARYFQIIMSYYC